MYYYAIAVGKKTGIFTSWNECKDYVIGIKGSRYKKFKTKEECETFISNNKNQNINTTQNNDEKNYSSNAKPKSSPRLKQMKLYSYISNDNSIESSSICGLGIFKNNIEKQISKILNNKELLLTESTKYTYESIIESSINILSKINPKILEYLENIDIVNNIKIHDILINGNQYKSHIIFTDGSLKRTAQNNNIVKLGFYIDDIDKYYILNMETNTTNNQCELLAIYFSLLLYYEKISITSNIKTITIISDSDYSINSLTTWYKTWQKNNWINSKKEPVKNKEVIELILDIITKLKSNGYIVHFIHQPSHKSIKDMHILYTNYVSALNNPNSTIIEKIKLKNNSDFALGNYYVDFLVQN